MLTLSPLVVQKYKYLFFYFRDIIETDTPVNKEEIDIVNEDVMENVESV